MKFIHIITKKVINDLWKHCKIVNKTNCVSRVRLFESLDLIKTNPSACKWMWQQLISGPWLISETIANKRRWRNQYANVIDDIMGLNHILLYY